MDPGTARTMRRYVQTTLGLSNSDEDEAGFYKFAPRFPKHRLRLNVLVTGFEPFRLRAVNTSTEAVRRMNLAQIVNDVVAPPWIELDLNIEKSHNVRVVWTCPAVITGAATVGTSAPLEGGAGILAKAKQMDASIVVIVGESGVRFSLVGESEPRFRNVMPLLRVERFARNLGSSWTADNNGSRMPHDGEIFPGRPAELESVVSRFTWAAAVRAAREELFSRDWRVRQGRVPVPNGQVQNRLGGGTSTVEMQNSAGDFICNETFYRLLLESRHGDPSVRGSDPSGRWVTLIHAGVHDDSARFTEIARGVARVIRDLIESMTWSTEIYGQTLRT